MLDLKIDKKLPHHYLITVAVHSAQAGKLAGEMYLKHGPLHFINDDVEKVRNSLILSSDKLFKTSQKQAMKNFGCTEIVSMVRGMDLAKSVNLCTMHHFSSPFEIEEEWFQNLVDLANKSEHNKELLKKSRVR